MIIPLLLIAIGLVFFARSLGFITDEVINVLWPLLLVVIGLGMMSNRYLGSCCEDGTCGACKINTGSGAKKGKRRRKRS